MKMCVIKDDNEVVAEGISIEILMSKQELNEYIDNLLTFRKEIEQYIEENFDKTDLGFTHLHYQDCRKKILKADSDIVLYVDMNKW